MGMFLDAFFLYLFEHFSSHSSTPPLLLPTQQEGGGGEGEGVFLDWFLEFLEGV